MLKNVEDEVHRYADCREEKYDDCGNDESLVIVEKG